MESAEARHAWSQVAVVRHFDWRRWRPVTTSDCHTVIRWLAPRSDLITHLCLDVSTAMNGRLSHNAFPALRSLVITQLRGDRDAPAVRRALRLSAAPIVHLTCSGALPRTVPYARLQSLTVALPASGWSMCDVLRQQLSRLPLLVRLDIDFGRVPSSLGDGLPFAAEWLMGVEMVVELPCLKHINFAQETWHEGPVPNHPFPGQPFAAMLSEHWWAAPLGDDCAIFPQLATWSMDSSYRLRTPSGHPDECADIHSVSLIFFQGTGRQKAIVHRAVAHDVSENMRAWEDAAAWGQAWELVAMIRDVTVAGGCPLEVSRGVDKFRSRHDLTVTCCRQ